MSDQKAVEIENPSEPKSAGTGRINGANLLVGNTTEEGSIEFVKQKPQKGRDNDDRMRQGIRPKTNWISEITAGRNHSQTRSNIGRR
jgi:hypothetical protein